MNILWTANIVPANVAGKLGSEVPFFGGWVESMAKEIVKYPDIDLTVACRVEDGSSFDIVVDGIRYLSITYGSQTSLHDLSNICEKIVEKSRPDLIHIEGTEFPHAGAIQFAGKKHNIPTVVSLQGVLNGLYDYQCGLLRMDELMFSKSLSDIFAGWTMHFRKTIWFKKRLKPEKNIIGNAKYVLGRTTWDRAQLYALNPKAKYYSCNRIMRRPFYEHKWDMKNIERHSIYVGNGYSALKGVHFVVQALPQLIREYPDIKLYVAGNKPYYENDKRLFIKKGYSLYLKKLVKDLGVEDHIVFTGPLNAEQVAVRLQSIHLYVLCSTIENSPNTLGEAMIVGTPCVSSYAGGAPDMAEDGKEALFYRANEPAMLAWNIKRIFDNDELALKLSKNGHIKASETHDPQKNAEKLYNAYLEILNDADK